MTTGANELLDRLQALDTCAVSDALDSLGESGTVGGIVRRSTRLAIAGRVRTLKIAAGRPPGGVGVHLGVRSIEEADDTDVIVVEQRTGIDAAAWGGLLSEAAHHKHIRGVVIDGPARDVDQINEIGLPVFSRAVTPFSARGRVHESAVNVPIAIGDVQVEPGDFVIADGTGVVFLRAAIAADVIARAEAFAERERQMSHAIHEHKPVAEVLGPQYETMLDPQN